MFLNHGKTGTITKYTAVYCLTIFCTTCKHDCHTRSIFYTLSIEQSFLPSWTLTFWMHIVGNVYTIYPGTGCTAFDQRKGYGPVPTFSLVRSHNCPEGTIFDVNTCVCNQPGRTVCNDHYYTDMYGDYNKGGHSYAPAWCDRAGKLDTVCYLYYTVLTSPGHHA